MKRLLPCTLMKTDWEGPLDAAVPPVCVDFLAARPRHVRYPLKADIHQGGLHVRLVPATDSAD